MVPGLSALHCSQSYDISPTLCPILRRSAGYTQKRLTENLKVPYYVGEHFSKEVTGVNLKNVERTVEDDYISNLRNNCWKEKQQSTFARKTHCSYLFIYLTVNISPGDEIKTILHIYYSFIMHHFCGFLQRKACYTEHAILETLICTKERRGLERQAALSCPRSRLRYMVDTAFTFQCKFLTIAHFSDHNL